MYHVTQTILIKPPHAHKVAVKSEKISFPLYSNGWATY